MSELPDTTELPLASLSSPVNDFEGYELVSVRRSQIKMAAYNPRRIGDKESRNLQRSLDRQKLVMPLVWNRRTGTLVAGHQRLSILDRKARKANLGDYSIRVCALDLSEKEEVELNIQLNNPNSQGSWDMDRFAELLKTDIDFDAASLDLAEVYQVFGDGPLAASPNRLIELSNQMKAAKELQKEIKKGNGREDTEFFLVLVFKGDAERKAFTDSLGLSGDRYANGATVAERLAGA